ncbi:hypothetical protein Pint_10348 [Pistacia integerrima]|uniref:Uncharacterized protein n=1 Tax=Pistacia integerrima TaxID=434235 RepID=A0ACC0XK13_9ROSI|nr:hypothetical protein Pint_10348 [Pistacia integerrima]
MLEADWSGPVWSARLDSKPNNLRRNGGCLFWFMGLRIYCNTHLLLFFFYSFCLFGFGKFWEGYKDIFDFS